MNEQKTCPAFIAEILGQCKAHPTRTAIIDNDGRVSTYADLLDVIERTSGYIREKGYAPGTFIVICLPNCMEYIAVEYGAWLAGCAVAPVSPFYPEARIEYIKNHCESPLVVDEAVLDEIRKAPRLEICETTADIAALFYTSGSTGNPKGVMHTFETLSRIDHFNEVAEMTPDDCFALGAPFSFIAWVLTVPPLRTGASIWLISRDTMTDIRKLQAFYDSGVVTCANISPSAYRQLRLSENKSLRFVVTGSERVSNMKPESSYKLVNLYGMTETLPIALTFNITKAYPNTPIGKPVSDCEIKIMDDGEICLRGPLTPGYFKDPERSAALWSGGWLHTGDLGRVLPDGNIEYINRKDWMVKINGQRVETGEIAQVIKEMDGVTNATAKGFTAPDGHQYIVAYYVADDSVDDDAVKDYLSGKLAHYMIPSYFVKMAELPINFNGKVDVKSLQSPLDMKLSGHRDIVAPTTENETVLCKAFESSLGISPIGIDDDFFSLGGDSIRVMQLQVLCPDLDLSSSLVYKYRTVRAICKALGDETGSEQPVPSPDICPLSKTQSGIFVECMNRRGEIAYNNPFIYKFTGPIDADKFARACEKAVAAHPNVFASILVDEDGIPHQKKNSGEGFQIEVENLSDSEFDALRRTLVQPFDILNDRLFRMRVIRTGSAVWFFADFHHIIFDGTSNSILLSDIEKAYEGGEVEPETFTGFDLACQEQKQCGTEFFKECRQWNLDNFCEVDRTSLPDPDRFIDNISFGKFELDTAVSGHAFAKAAEKLGITENVLATAAFGYMLGACTHAKSSAFTIVYNGRKSVRTMRTISMMVKTLPVTCKWDGKTLIGDYVQSVKDQMGGSMAHDLFSFAEICAATSFDSRVIFTYQDELLERTTLCGAKCEMSSLLENATGEPFTVQLYKNNGSLVIRAEYRSNMYSEAYVRKFMDCYSTILSSLLMAEKDTPASDIRLVGQKEQADLLKTGFGGKMDYDRSETIVGMMRKHAAKRPQSRAVIDENGSISYSELDRMSDRLASLLIKEGVKEENFVALMLPRLRYFPISYIACYKAGAAYVPMDSEYPLDRLQYMLEDSQAKVLITTHDIYDEKMKEGGLETGKIIFIDDLHLDAANFEEAEVIEGIDRSAPERLAYMIYTSGTTGKPKGVMIEHHSLCNMMHWTAGFGHIGPDTRIAQHASFSFDASVMDLMTALAFGAELHILSSALRKDLAGMNRYINENRIDGVTMSTLIGVTLLRMYDVKLKYMVVGGEKLTGPFNTHVRLCNGYGPTEFTIISSFYEVDPENVPDNIPIGRPLPNTTSAVVDSCGRLLPQGIAGELVLIGEQISRGYWHREDITAERFAPCPFIEGERMYHTGDLVKWNEDGELMFLGRIDTQVKLRGFRIELGEIESTIQKFDGIKNSVVVVKEISGQQHLCAYYCSDKDFSSDDLRDFLAKSLTDYMVPTVYVRLETMPYTPNGKVDLRKLPIPEIKAEEIVEASTENEKKLFEIVADYLKTREFGVTTNLISMGLTSLGAITLSLQMERKAGISIPSSKLLEQPTIREWAGASSDAAQEETVSYQKQELYPMTDNQTGIYIDWEQHRDSIQYNVPMFLCFTGITADAVAGAVKSFVESHPYLKTHLKEENGQVMQLRCDDAEVKVEVKQLDTLPDKAFFQGRLKPFNLFEGPLYRFEVFSHGDKVWLLSDIHHIVFDGGSEAILVKELADCCNCAALVPEKFSAYDYSLYYKEWKESGDYATAEQYFVSLLDAVSPATLPSSASGKEAGTGRYSVAVHRGLLRSCCRNAGVTENALFLTAVTQVLHRITREDNISILTVSSGRSLSALERTAGMFVQTLPVVSRHAAKTVREALSTMHSQVVETLSRDKFPYTGIVEKTGLKASILLAYQGDVLGGEVRVAGHPVQFEGLALETAKFPISINVDPGKDSTELTFEYDKAAYTDADIRMFADAVKAFTDNMIQAGVDAPLGEVSCVSTDEQAELVRLGSGPHMDIDRNATLVTMFRQCVAAHPDSPAVSDIDGTLSYCALDRASDRLAGILLDAGVHKDDFIGLMLPRRKEFIISVLGVYKCGAAYVPMDYEYPFDRLQYMLEDSLAKVLVTTREIYNMKAAEGEFKTGKVIFIDEIDFSGADDVQQVNKATPDSLAYMIYTSGTTGKPKGVMIEHHALTNAVSWYGQLCKVVCGTNVCAHPSFSFDASVLDIMTSLSAGGHLHIMDETCRKDPELISKFFIDNNIEVLAISTQLGMMLLSSYKLPIRCIMMGGEKLTGKFDPSVMVMNGYGPTEFTVCSSYKIVEPDKDYDNIPIGTAVPNTISAIVDSCGRLVPRGVPGELVLIGPQIARGYWNKEEITRKRFVDCPFVPGQKMYHTGDLAKWSDEGELLFSGRIDTQVKLRGFRIELGEIESVMSGFETVKTAVAQVKEIAGVQHLCGYFTASSKVDTTALKAHLSSCLTAYMVPDALIQLDEMPLTPNGKVDLKKLPLPDLSSHTTTSFEAPEGEMEQTVAEAFGSVLGIAGPIGRNDSFFQLGGTSLLVMKVVVLLSEKGMRVTYGDVFKYSTPCSLAAFMEGYEAGCSTASESGAASGPAADCAADTAKLPVIGEDGYDYSAINRTLESNTIDNIENIGQLDVNPIGDVLLLGATGYLGIHILENLLTKGEGKVYCVIRGKKGVTCEGRLKSYLMYYFDNTHNDLFGKRLFVIEGDMTDDGVMETLLKLKVDTVINCAANVKHFAAGDEIEKINLSGAEKLIEYCLKTGSRLVQTSTHSISGQMDGGSAYVMHENELYFGQKLMTKYQISKFQAERAILEACSKGLKAKIMRLGNLMPRFSDGEFQINIENNGFMARMRAYYLIGCIASSHLHSAVEFAPIDETADAILTLARTPDKYTVFHPFNNHTIYIDDVVATMRKCGLDMKITDNAEFSERLNFCLNDDHLNPFITTLLAYGSHNNYVMNSPSLDFTVNVLNAMDWRWPITGSRYLSDAFEKMKALEFFEK